MARISNNSPQRAIGDVKLSVVQGLWTAAFFSVNSAPPTPSGDGRTDLEVLQKVPSTAGTVQDQDPGADVTIDSDGSTLAPTITPTFTISGPLVVHSSHILSLRGEDDGDSLTFYRTSGLAPGRATYHNARPALDQGSNQSSSLSGCDPITPTRSGSASSLLDPPADQCLAPIPTRLWGSRQQHACKHADTFTAGQVAALTFDGQHHHLHLHQSHPTVLGPALSFSPRRPPTPAPDITGRSPGHETTLDCSVSSTSSSPQPSPPLFAFPDSQRPPVDELITSCPETAVSAVQLEEHPEQHSSEERLDCPRTTSPPPDDDVLLAEPSCTADPQLPPHPESLPPLPPSPASSHASDEFATLAHHTLDTLESESAMPKLRSSDSGATSRARAEQPRPISTSTTASASKIPSSPHSISRMFSTKIRGLLHTRDRRASSPLSPVAPLITEALADSKPSSASVPSTPRTAHPPPMVHPVHPGTVVQAPTEDYGLIPISGPFQQNGGYTPSIVEPASGRSSYRSMDSPTTRTESTSQDSSTSTESTGIRSHRSSFRSLEEDNERERKRSESPITPDGDYKFAREKTDTMNTMDSMDYHYEDAQDDARSQEVVVYLDEGAGLPPPQIPSVQIAPATPTVSKHDSHFSAPRSPRPASSRGRSISPATRRAPSFVASIREDLTGRETPSFLAPRPAPIPIPSSGAVKPAMRPNDPGPKLLRSNTMVSRSATVNSLKAPLSLTPQVRKNYAVRPSTANRPNTSLSTSSMASNRGMHSPQMPGSPREGDLLEVDETLTLGTPASPCGSTFDPNNAASPAPLRGKPSSLMSASIPHEIAIPPAFDARSYRTAPVSPTAPSEFSFTVGLSPKRIPDDMQMSPIKFSTEGSDADVSIPIFLPLPSPVMEPRRSRTVSLRHAFTRLNSHVNRRGANTHHITPDIISRPSTATKNGIPTHAAEVPATILEYEENVPTTGRPRATSTSTQPSGSSFSRWKSVHTRSSSNPSNPPPVGPLPAVPTLAPGVPQPVALTDEERSEIARMPGTIFLKTAIKADGPDGELTIQEHRLKPRKGMQESGPAGKCRFCRRGPFPNMWVCLDHCGFVMCRVCANESVQNGEAELF